MKLMVGVELIKEVHIGERNVTRLDLDVEGLLDEVLKPLVKVFHIGL